VVAVLLQNTDHLEHGYLSLFRIPKMKQLSKNIDLPTGAFYVPSYLSLEKANAIIKEIDRANWRHDLKRRVQHYGYRYNYKARSVGREDYLGQLPSWLGSITNRLLKDECFSKVPDQVIVNEYEPGQGISPHVDCVPCFENTIASLSLGSACEMNFTHLVNGETKAIILHPNSLFVLSGAARHEWSHGIRARKSDLIDGKRTIRKRRISLTFRTVKTNYPPQAQ